MHKSKINYVLNPLFLCKCIDLSYDYLKMDSTRNIASSIITKYNLCDLFNVITQVITRKIVYCIKNKNNKILVDIYLYYEGSGDYYSPEYLDYINDAILLFTILNKDGESDSVRDCFTKISSENHPGIFSYDLNETGELCNEYITAYSNDDVFKYNLKDFSYVQQCKVSNVLSCNLSEFMFKQVYLNNEFIPSIVNDLLCLFKNIYDETLNYRLIFSNNYQNNSVRIYLSSVNFDTLYLFLTERFGYQLTNEGNI